MTTNNIIL